MAPLRPHIDPKSPVRIWRQIEHGVRILVGSTAWPPGSMVPSVRALAADLLVNPATVAKAYQRLCDDGVLVVQRGEGTFVAARPPIVGRAERRRELRAAAQRYLAHASSLGADAQEAYDALAEFLHDVASSMAGGTR